MAFSWDHLVESVVPAIISGGGTAVSTILAFVRDFKKRLEELEKRVGSIEGKAGLVYSMHLAEEGLKSLRERLDARDRQDNDIPREPPRWRMPSYSNMDVLTQFEDKLRDLDRRLKDMEDSQERLEGKVKKCVTDAEFEDADRQRADEIAAVKTTMAEVRGLLQGLQSALGLIGKPR